MTEPTKKLVDLPRPIDGSSLAKLESEITRNIEQLADNACLERTITSAPWGWSASEIRRKTSPREARILALTKLGSILGNKRKRLTDAEFRMRFSHGDTSWDKDFGQPSSVLRIEVALPQGEPNLSISRWHPGVVVGKVNFDHYLIWEWGE